MIQTFSFNRVKLLFTKYFVEKWRSDLRDFMMLFAFCTVFAFNYGGAYFGIFFFVLFSWIAGAKSFSMFKNKTHGFDYLLIPASTLEKTFTGIVLSHIYRILLYFIAFILGVKFGSFLYSFHPANEAGVLSIGKIFDIGSAYWHYILSFFSTLSIFVFASVFFRKSAFMKTLLSYFGFVTVIAIITVVVIVSSVEPMVSNTHAMTAPTWAFVLQDYEFAFKNMTLFGKISTIGSNIFIILFGWTMTFLRLREKEA